MMPNLSVIGIMEGYLYIVAYNSNKDVSVYQVPVSRVSSNSVDLTHVSPMLLEEKWPFLTYYPHLSDLKYQMIIRTGLTVIRGGPTLMYVTGFNRTGTMCPETACPTDMHNIDTISLSMDPEWAFTMQLWQNDEDFDELTKIAVWISSSRPRRFFYLRLSSESGQFFFREYLISYAYSNQIIPIELTRTIICGQGNDKVMLVDSGKCEDQLNWLTNVRTGFTDKKWFRMFTNDKVYIFEQKAFQNLGQPYDLFELSFAEFFKCKPGKF